MERQDQPSRACPPSGLTQQAARPRLLTSCTNASRHRLSGTNATSRKSVLPGTGRTSVALSSARSLSAAACRRPEAGRLNGPLGWGDHGCRTSSADAMQLFMAAFYATGRFMVLFRGRIRRWREDKPGGLAVIDIPPDLVTELGGRRQMRMAGSLNGVPFAGSTMLVAGGGFCVGVSRAALHASGVAVGDEVEAQLEQADDWRG